MKYFYNPFTQGIQPLYQGPQGIQGPAGRDGSNGLNGDQGPQGVKGDPGSMIISKQLTDVATTPGNTSEQTLFEYTLPGGTLGPNDGIRITAFISFPKNTNSKVLKLYFGSLLSFNPSIASATYGGVVVVDLILNRNSLSNQISTPIGLYDSGLTQTDFLYGTENTANNVVIKLTATPNAADVIKCESIYVELIKN